MAHQPNFQILRIASYSDHPVRNSAGELIFGNHILWEDNNNNTYVDGQGSFAPNIFSYDFKSPLSSNSTLNVSIKIISHELLETDFLLQGSLDSSKVFESQVFTIGSAEEITIAVRVVEPYDSPVPLSITGEFSWALVPKESGRQLHYTFPHKTRLELYWISADIHGIFLTGLSGIQVNFLRYCILSRPNPQSKTDTRVLLTPQDATWQVYANYSKQYDTVSGSPHFGVSGSGGQFNYSYYISARSGGPPGSLQPIVNCYDQGAMVQVLARVGSYRPSWLYQSPNGWINTTQLVGVPQPCNNPFFRYNNTPPLIAVNDQRRTRFGNHVFNGLYGVWDPRNPNDRILDACGGPNLGTRNPADYLTQTIDRQTDLYRIMGGRPGTVSDIVQYPGVTGILAAFNDDSGISKSIENFLGKFASPKSTSQTHWDDVPQWVKQVLGDGCDIAFQQISIGNGVAESLWHLTGADGADGDVVLRVRVETRIGENGDLNFERSSVAAYEDLAFVLKNVEIDLGPNYEGLETLWAPAPFEDHAQHALQYAAHIPEGRILLVSGNSIIDISGGSSSAILEPLVRKILTHTTVDVHSSIHIPDVTRYSYEIPEIVRGPSNAVKGIGSSFSVKCNVDDVITTASADIEDYGVLLSRANIEIDEANKSSTVTFVFVTRTLGTHDVDLRFAEALTLNTSTKRIQITVIAP
jgi:hypothetical protein